MALSEQLLLSHIESLPRRRASFKQLLRELHLRGTERQQLKALLNALVRSRRLVETRHAYELPPVPRPLAGDGRSHSPTALAARRAGDLTGRISIHRDGFAFVLPDVPRKDFGADIFIPPPFVGNAMHGDTVAVKIVRRDPDGRAEGHVVDVVRRAHATVVGTFIAGPRGNVVKPFDDRLREPIFIPRGDEIPPGQAGIELHRVLGDEARRQGARGGERAESHASGPESLHDAVVDVEITSYATPTAAARGRVIEVLGHAGDFGVDVEMMIRKHHLPHRFPAEVLSEAQAILPTLPASELAARRDFRHLPIVTIDGETAKDFDDAVYVHHLDNGNYGLQVHIADVAYYVQAETAIDREARLRGTSVYFPDRSVPMLPAELSTDLCSLRPHEDRLVMSCLMEIDGEGEIVDYELVAGVIRSAERMTYTLVNAVLAGDAAARERYALLAPIFERMAELQRILYRRRIRRGSIDFDLPEPEIAFDDFGLMRAIVKSERNIAHRLIEEFMLAAAGTVARHFERLNVPAVYRIHEKPDVKKIAEFEEVARSFGYSLGFASLPMRKIRTRIGGKVRVIEVPVEDELQVTPQHYQRLAAQIAGKPEERILSYLMLRSLKQARYDGHNAGHFALATDCYTHFTSPIRRYPDLIVHRQLKALLAAGVPGQLPAPERKRGKTPAPPAVDAVAIPGLFSMDAIQQITRESSDAERRADDAERELMEWKKVRFMENRFGEEFPALILHVTKSGFFVELTDLFIEGFVAIDALADDRYFFHEAGHELVGERSRRRFRLGDRITVTVERIDPVRLQVHFLPVLPEEAVRERRKPRKQRDRNGRKGRQTN